MTLKHTAHSLMPGSKERAGDLTGITTGLNEGVAAHHDRITKVAIPPRSAAVELHIGEIELPVEVHEVDCKPGIANNRFRRWRDAQERADPGYCLRQQLIIH